MTNLNKIRTELTQQADDSKVAVLSKFFKSFPGGYGEGDFFLGVTVPVQRAVARKYYTFLSPEETVILLRENIHEHRLTALFIMVLQYEKAKTREEKETVVYSYLGNIDKVNNWDLVDSSAHKILGPWLDDKDKRILYDFANTENLWKQRISIISTLHFIRNHQYEVSFDLAEILLNHKHDLIHKAVGWMLREIGNRNFELEYNFLKKHYKKMPRTMLRYAIEKFDEELRQEFLKRE